MRNILNNKRKTAFVIIFCFFVSLLFFTKIIHRKPKLGIDYIEFLDEINDSLFQDGAYEMRRKHKAIFTGITRDNGKDIPTMLAAFKEIGAKFKDYRIIIFENDSSDNTLKLLKEAEASDNRIKIISQNFNLRKRPSIKFMADIRNQYLREIESKEYDDFDIVIVMDMDMQYGVDPRAIEHSFSKIDRWEAVCSNGFFTYDGRMYDGFAFRNEEFPRGPNELGTEWYWKKIVSKTQKIYPVTLDLIKATSCFGGMAIYQKDYIKGCRYDSIGEDCEHVKFNQCIIEKNGGRLYMNPAQMIRYDDNVFVHKPAFSLKKSINRSFKKFKKWCVRMISW